MKILNIPFFLLAIVASSMLVVVDSNSESTPTEQEIIDALTPPSGALGRTRSMSGGRGVKVSGVVETPPSIDLKVNFEFDSARLDNESILTLNVLGRALSSDALKGQVIEVIGHTDAKGTLEYNDVLSQRRAAAVVSYIVRNFTIDSAPISSKGMGERQLFDKDNPEAAINRRVEIRNVTRAQ